MVCPVNKGARGIWAKPLRPMPSEYHRNLLEIPITNRIVAISQRPHQRAKSESVLSNSFERQRSSRRSLKESAAAASRIAPTKRSRTMSLDDRQNVRWNQFFSFALIFCDSGFLICGGKDMKISRYLPNKYREIFHFKIKFNISSRAKK